MSIPIARCKGGRFCTHVHGTCTAIQAPKNTYWPLGGYAPGHYMQTCIKCGCEHVADKRSTDCLDCAVAWAKHELAKAQMERDEARRALLDIEARRDTLFNKIAHGDDQHCEWLSHPLFGAF